MRRRVEWALCILALGCSDDGGQPLVRDAQADEPDARVHAPDGGIDAAASNLPDASARDAGSASDAGSLDAAVSRVRLPPVGGRLDYQLGGAYAPPAGVTIVSRDRHDEPAAGLYSICYVNGFQAQQSENDFWLDEAPDLVLRDERGEPVVDRDWDEMLLDIGTPEKRTRLIAVVGGYIQGCARDGFDAVEIDNLDSYTRSGNRLRESDAIAFIAGLAQVAHESGLAIAQKNSSELASRKRELGTDFVVAEECARYDECDVYMEAYGEHVLMIEYRRTDFTASCQRYPAYPIVLRDVNLVPRGGQAYVFDDC
jgi:hypothetical protein